MRGTHRGARWQRGQALVEFSLSIVIFLVMLMGIFDVGRAIFMYNGVSEAAREIARRTSVYPHGSIAGPEYLGASTQTQEAVATQRQLVPGMAVPTPGLPDFACVDIAGDASVNDPCASGDTQDYVRVTVSATYQPITLLGITGPITLQSTSTVAIP
jgi:Flp pilus assembly protein TadG